MRRRDFVTEAAALAMAAAPRPAAAAAAAGRRPRIGETESGKSVLSFVASKNTREAAHLALKSMQETVVRAIGNKRVVIKANVGCPQGDHRHECTDVEQLRGILDFLKPIHDQQVVIAEGAAAQACSVQLGYERYGYLPIEKEYNVKLIDSNDLPVTRTWIRAGQNFPRPIHIIDLFLDHDVYLISACRLKTSGGVIVTLSVKNVVMGAPICHYRSHFGGPAAPPEINEKAWMHGGPGSVHGRELAYNIFTVANLGVYPDLTVLDGVVGAEGNGPWNATPIEHGVALASNDCVAADRVGAELMGVDYSDLMYLQWCAQAGIGRDDLANVTFLGEDYRKHITKYRLNRSADSQRKWIYELREARAKG